ncbi:MAG: hypothetical protein FWE40_03435 [Oscillospiraceae bacterium]|nr:hypothetical protein [Oscillospiraceae bacterium]
MQELKENLAGLLKVKTILTLMIIIVFCYKTLADIELTSEFVMIASAVVTYYFAKDKNIDTERL